jgi:hypothetical protein
MIKKYLFSLITISAITVAAFSQERWENGNIRADGRTAVDGVEVFYLKTQCQGNDVLFLKLVNHNSYPVKAEWIDSILENDSKWSYSSNEKSKNVTIAASSEVKGSCSGSRELIVHLKDLSSNPNLFQYFSASGLTITKIQ